MKRVLPILLAVFALTFCACETKKEKQNADNVSFADDSLRNIIEQKDSELNDMMSTLNEIQDGFRKINEAEGRVAADRRAGEANNREQIRENVEFIQRTMQMNRELIANLRQQLKTASASNARVKETLETTLANLQAQLEDKDREIAQLRNELAQKDIVIADQSTKIEDLNENVSNLTSDNEEKARTVAKQDAELHTAYYVFGTKKELSEQNILSKGEVFSKANVNRDYFTKIDIRVTKVIKLYSKSAQLMTTHPAGTYSLDKDAKGQYTLRVTDPTKFWSVSKYLVIKVK